jgi:hypothetical protein
MEIKQKLFGDKFSFLIFLLCFYLNGFIYCIQINTQCKEGKYYDRNLFECLNCPEFMIPRSDGNFLEIILILVLKFFYIYLLILITYLLRIGLYL